MAPEQAKGRPVDRRADIWAFGVVLFEMLAGRRGFEAEDVSETLAAVLTREVDWTALPASTPRARARAHSRLSRARSEAAAARHRRCAARDRTTDRAARPTSRRRSPLWPQRPRRLWRRMLPWAVAVVAAIGGRRCDGRLAPHRAGRTRCGHARRDASDGIRAPGRRVPRRRQDRLRNLGRERTVLVLRMADQFEGKVIPGSEDGGWPIFSPDGQWIAYSTVSHPEDQEDSRSPAARRSRCATEVSGGARPGAPTARSCSAAPRGSCASPTRAARPRP